MKTITATLVSTAATIAVLAVTVNALTAGLII